MGWFKANPANSAPRGAPTPGATQPEPAKPSALEVLQAAAGDMTIVQAILTPPTDPGGERVEDFRSAIAGYEPYAHEFVTDTTPADFAAKKRMIDRREEQRRTLEEAGGWGLAAQLAANVVDPINLIPFGGVVTKGQRATRVGGSMLRTAGLGLGVGAVDSMIRDQVDPTQTTEEAITNTLVSGITAGILGGGYSALSRQDDGLHAALREEVEGAFRVDAGGLSADTARTMSPDDLRPASAFGLEKFEAGNPISDNPLLRTLQSPDPAIAQTMSDLAELPYLQAGNAKGVASPVAAETRAKAWMGQLNEAFREMDDLYLQYRSGKARELGAEGVGRLSTQTELLARNIGDIGRRFGSEGDGKLTYPEFRSEVGRAMRRGDTSEVAEAAEAAKRFRQRLFDPLKDEAISLRLLDETIDVKGAESYLTRVYNRDLIARESDQFADRLATWWDNEQLRTPPGDRLSQSELRGLADDVVEKILSSSPMRTTYDISPNLRGPLKERTLDVPDAVIERWLESDVEKVARVYARTMAMDVEIARAFGTPDMEQTISGIQSRHGELLAKVPDGEKKEALRKRLKSGLDDLRDVNKRLRGLYGAPAKPDGLLARTARTVRKANLVSMLGQATLSASTDAARLMLASGSFGRFLSQGLPVLMRDLQTGGRAVREARLAGTILEGLDARMDMMDAFDDYGRATRFENFVDAAARSFPVANGMILWNTTMKSMVAPIVQSRTMQAITKGAKAKPGEIRRLRFLGIDEGMAERIAAQFRKHGEKDGDLWVANTEQWTDPVARRTYRAALAKEVDDIIITGGQDRPLWMSTELGRVIGQFKSFTMYANSRILIRGLQQRDVGYAQAAVTSVIIGMMVYYLRTVGQGKEPSDNPAKWVAEGIDRSGITGWMFEANNMAEGVSMGRVGVNPLIGESASTRYANRNQASAILGPTAGRAQDTIALAGAGLSAVIPDANGETRPLTRADIAKARRQALYQNLFWTSWIFDQVEDATGDALGLPEKAEGQRK